MSSLIGQTRPRRPAALQPGFTLAELLVVIMILGILASITTFALWDAQEQARRSRTQAQIQKIHELLMIKWESYRTRPVPVKTSNMPPELAAKARLNALRQLMRMEMPDHITDVTDDPGPVLELPDGTVAATMGIPALTSAYRRRALLAGSWSSQHQQAECLHLILASMQDGPRSALDFFKQSEIGDLDEDGMPEILDGWGKPIRFLRWAPGYLSALQDLGDVQPDPFDPLKLDPRWKNNDANDRHFPDDRGYPSPTSGSYNPKLDDPRALFPLIFSAGPDGYYNVILDVYALSAVTASGELRDDDYDASAGDYNDITFASGNQLHYVNTHTGNYYNYTPPIATYPDRVWPTNDLDGATNFFPLWNQAPRNDPYAILPGAAMPAGGGVGVAIGARYGVGADDNIDNQTLVVK